VTSVYWANIKTHKTLKTAWNVQKTRLSLYLAPNQLKTVGHARRTRIRSLDLPTFGHVYAMPASNWCRKDNAQHVCPDTSKTKAGMQIALNVRLDRFRWQHKHTSAHSAKSLSIQMPKTPGARYVNCIHFAWMALDTNASGSAISQAPMPQEKRRKTIVSVARAITFRPHFPDANSATKTSSAQDIVRISRVAPRTASRAKIVTASQTASASKGTTAPTDKHAMPVQKVLTKHQLDTWTTSANCAVQANFRQVLRQFRKRPVNSVVPGNFQRLWVTRTTHNVYSAGVEHTRLFQAPPVLHSAFCVWQASMRLGLRILKPRTVSTVKLENMTPM
jgi:hypothetical protein